MELAAWQEKVFEGFRRGELAIITSGRRHGKSYVAQWMNEYLMFGQKSFIRIDKESVLVDNEPWYTIKCTEEVAKWIRAREKDHWYEHSHPQPLFEIHESIYLLLGLKWS